MDNFVKKMIKKIIFASLVLILIIIVINFIPSSFVPHNNDWIPFYGSFVGAIMSGIIAGLLTYEGVKKTIEYTDKTRSDDFRKSIMPFFQVILAGTGGDKHSNHYSLENIGEKTEKQTNYIIRIKLKNIGMKDAINLRCDDDLIENAVNVNQVIDKKISFDIKVNNSTYVNNCYNFYIDFQDIIGNLYVQEYELKFEGDITIDKLKIVSSLPRLL